MLVAKKNNIEKEKAQEEVKKLKEELAKLKNNKNFNIKDWLKMNKSCGKIQDSM